MVLEIAKELGSELASIVGPENVSSDQFILISYSEDASPFEGNPPQIVVRPETTEQISKIMKFALKKRIPIVPVGGRSSINGSTIPRVNNAIMLDLTKMTKILELNEDIMTVTVQIGITWSELIHKLKEKIEKIKDEIS